MKKGFALLLGLTLMCALCVSWAETDADALYEQGLTAFLAQDYETAFEILAPLAETGYANAQHMLGYFYCNGLGVEADGEKAVAYYTLAAEQGISDAAHNLGWMYEHGVGVEQDLRKAWDYYVRGADLGNPMSFY